MEVQSDLHKMKVQEQQFKGRHKVRHQMVMVTLGSIFVVISALSACT